MADKPLLQLNDRWRIAHDGKAQWILQVRKGNPRAKASGYASKKFYLRRTPLIAAIDEYCGDVAGHKTWILASWPERYSMFRETSLCEAMECSYFPLRCRDRLP